MPRLHPNALCIQISNVKKKLNAKALFTYQTPNCQSGGFPAKFFFPFFHHLHDNEKSSYFMARSMMKVTVLIQTH